MEIYLDANATTPVLPCAIDAALAAMAETYGNPSSTHSTGLRARAVLNQVRERARSVLAVPSGRIVFTSGATEAIQTAVFSALLAIRKRDPAQGSPRFLLHGATEHKAVQEALHHWNDVLGLQLEVLAIPVRSDGRHDLDWLRAHVADAGLVCTMAANNETGVISDLDGIASAIAQAPALWLVDGVQALGKLTLDLLRRKIHYACFSGHKLYSPKGIGLLYLSDDAPLTPLLAGGGQEGELRAGTENMAGIAALGAVLQALEEGKVFKDPQTLASYRSKIVSALQRAFPGVVFNAPESISLPTTLNFSVPGLSSKVLQDLFDAAGMRVSSGSACSASIPEPSPVLLAMGLSRLQAESAVRMSFGPAEDARTIDDACERIIACGEALRTIAYPADGTREATESLREPVSREALSAVELSSGQVESLLQSESCIVVDIREAYEQRVGQVLICGRRPRCVPLSSLTSELPEWLSVPQDKPLLFLCRSGSRSGQLAATLRGLGHGNVWSIQGGIALWREAATDEQYLEQNCDALGG
jgi:cysteine sulfinate desulfinase/cysteine desulfurase-like protein/rhodanese-related sulfurtransferase